LKQGIENVSMKGMKGLSATVTSGVVYQGGFYGRRIAKIAS
jgi:hypothetical protein